jgi:hypothetical protein
MKKYLLLMMCLVIAMASYSKKSTKELWVSGDYIATKNVKFEVAIVNDDASRIVVQTKSSTFSYRIRLKIGNEYVIKFMKGDQIKELYITAEAPGTMELDVDFETETAAQVCYNEKADDYNLTLLYKQ